WNGILVRWLSARDWWSTIIYCTFSWMNSRASFVVTCGAKSCCHFGSQVYAEVNSDSPHP
ncbi:MAG: hypothetical protein OSA92_13600, partial [Pirellulaceae bacterium]|nr:hypothetical protein [Pirellulaceae bacterium]